MSLKAMLKTCRHPETTTMLETYVFDGQNELISFNKSHDCNILYFVLQKRRSARNTQRKKYVDDIMLSISDEDSRKSSSPGPRNDNNKSSTPERSGSHFSDSAVKPNFVYVVSFLN